MERLYNIQLSPEGKVIRIVVEQLLHLPLKFHLSKLSRNEKQNPVPKQWISKDVLRHGSQSERAKIAIHWFGELNETIKNASKRFVFFWFSLSCKDIVDFHCTVMRPVLEYCSPIFHHSLPDCLSERVQKRALSIIAPDKSCKHCLVSFGLSTLYDRRNDQCI